MPASIMSPLSISPRKRSAHSRRHRVSQSRCAEGTGVGVRLFVVEAGLHVRHFGRTATQAKYAATILAKVPISMREPRQVHAVQARRWRVLMASNRDKRSTVRT